MAVDKSSTEVFAEQLAQLRQAYVERVPGEVDAMSALTASLSGSESDHASLNELHHRLHKLAGSGGSFGFETLSVMARGLERRVKGWLDGAWSSVDAEARCRLREDIAALKTTLDETNSYITVASHAAYCPTPGEPVLVWLIEADVQAGQALARQLESFNYRVRVFSCLNDAEHAAQGGQPNLVIMDIKFEQDSIQAAGVVGCSPSLQALACPFIFISAVDDFLPRVRAAQLGTEGYFPKPLDVPRLVSRMEQIVDKLCGPSQRVLIVDDDKDLAIRYRMILQGAGMEAEVLQEPREMIEKIAAFRPELVLMDMHMPDYTGPDLAAVIRQYDSWAGLPIVYLSAETDLDLQIKALSRGADDFLTKPVPDSQLIAAIRSRIDRARQLAAQISKDSLTGLFKHATIKEAVKTGLLRARRTNTPMTVVLLDIDHFKAVNDTYGHAVGDVVISSVAMLLRQRLRQSDIIGRYGGEEFMAILPECDTECASRLMDEIRRRFAAVRFNHKGADFACTLSAGVACSDRHPSFTAAELIVAADQALYDAKQGGRNQVRAATPTDSGGGGASS